MRFKKLDLNLLVALDHMLALQSVSAAADKMFMSQSAMSNALTRLRTYFDDPLLVQVGKRMEITPRAEAMKPAIRDILVRIEATIDSQPAFDPTVSTRNFNILVSDYTVVIACANGPFAKKAVDLDDYQNTPHAIMVPPSTDGQPAETFILDKADVTRNVELKTFSFSALPHLLPGTGRIATVHAQLARTAMKSIDLVVHPLPFEAPPFRQMIQWHSYRDRDPGIKWMRDTIAKAASTLSKYS